MPIEEVFMRRTEEILNVIARYWTIAEFRREMEIVKKYGLKPETKRMIIKELEEKRESLLRQREILLAEGRKAWEEYKRTGNLEKAHEARSKWGRAGFFSRYSKVLTFLMDFWVSELAEEIKLEYVGVDADTGRKIFFDTSRKVYVEVDETGKITYESSEIEIDESLSLETESGHDAPLICEATTRFRLRAMDKRTLQAIWEGIQKRLMDFITKPSTTGTYLDGIKGFFRFGVPARKVGIEVRIRAKKETPIFPRAFAISERVSRLYPEPRPYPWAGYFEVDWSEEVGKEIKKHHMGKFKRE